MTEHNVFLRRRINPQQEGPSMQEMLRRADVNSSPPMQHHEEYAAPHQVETSSPTGQAEGNDSFDSLSEALRDSREDAEYKRLATYVYHLRYDLLKGFSISVGTTPDKVHEWAAKIVKPAKEEKEQPK